MLRVEAQGPVLYVTLARPEVRNALNEELIGAISSTLASLDRDVRVVVLSGEGGAFCAGGDLAWMRKASEFSIEQNEQDAAKLARMFDMVATSRALVIAKVHGPTFGGGCGLVAAADVGLAATDATFAFSEARLGLVPATISPFVLRKIGHSHARALFATGEVFGADRALRMGLVHEVHDSSELDSAVNSKIASVLSCGPEAVAESKKLASSDPLDLGEAARLLAKVRAGDEAKEGISAFLEKRRASYVVRL